MSSARPPHEPTTALPSPLREMFEAEGAFVCRSLRYLGVPEADLDDLLQEVFLVVHKRLTDYEEKGRVRSWLYSICARVVNSERRKQKRRREQGPPSERLEQTSAASPLEHVEDREALDLGWRLLHELPQEQREVFVLYEVEDLPMSEIARALDCPLQTAYSRLYAARTRILAQVQRLSVESES